MSLALDREAQGALDLAKRCVPEGGQLDAALLLAALCQGAEIKARHPRLSEILPPPEPQRRSVPAKVPVAPDLQPVLLEISLRDKPATSLDLVEALLASDAGRTLLAGHGLGADEAHHPPPVKSAPSEDGSAWRRSPERAAAAKELAAFGRMLTTGDPPHRGVAEIEGSLKKVVLALSKMKNRNPLVVGPPGCGKSALVYELARRMVRGDPSIPARLRECDIFELSPSFLRSGASMVGQYDERVKSLLQALQANPKIILFVDEVHSLLQSGMHERSPFSEANEAFKPALQKGEITLIGCTTLAEYRHYIAPDAALDERFAKITLEPPSREATKRILAARRPAMEEYYSPLKIPDAALERAVALTEDYLPSRHQPRKSIQLLDSACAYAVAQDPPLGEVNEDMLWQALEDVIGHGIARREQVTEEDVYRQLSAKIIGQDEALRGITRAFVAGLGAWGRKKGPRGVFFFAGPTGVGKTETALALSRILGGGREALLRVDCNTLHASGSDAGPAIHRLLGVPPGYLGYVRGQGGMLSKIRDMPECVVLFDEVEKAGSSVADLLLQILDEGKVQDSDANDLDFRRSYVVFTSNAGVVRDERVVGFEQAAGGSRDVPRVDVETVKADLSARGFREEFLGKIRHFFVFTALGLEAVTRIIGRQLDGLRESAEVRGYRLEWDPAIVAHLGTSWQPRFGVRHLTAILRNRIVEQLSVAEAQGELKGVNCIRLEVAAEGGGTAEVTGGAARERRGETLVISLA